MIAYIDSSVLLRIVLGQEPRLPEWPSVDRAIASGLIEAECLRTLDRLRTAEGIPDTDIAVRREAVYKLLDAMALVEPTRLILSRAAQPLRVVLGI